ncbi:MAG: hypothetical protein IJP88_01490 [Synergistaceae bacterium]|nr:hypothetical protein [Synergistaceae bacterium]
MQNKFKSLSLLDVNYFKARSALACEIIFKSLGLLAANYFQVISALACKINLNL